MTVQDRELAVSVLRCEYERIKEEQKARIGFRDNLIYATLASMAVVVGATLQKADRTELLLLLPPVSLLLGWTYLVNDQKISAIGAYIRYDLTPRLTTMVGGLDPVFGWETAHRSDDRRVSRKYLQLAADLLLFVGAPVAGLATFWVYAPPRPVTLTISILEAVCVGILAYQTVVYADVKSGH